MRDSKGTRELIAKLKSGDPASRELAASELADLAEADQLRGEEYQVAVRALIDAALAEKDAVVKESMFNALSSAAPSALA